MKVSTTCWLLVLLAMGSMAGCQEKPEGSSKQRADAEAAIHDYLVALGPEDQRLAEQQKYCPVMPEVRLGEMGTPLKVQVQGELVFVCCKSCVRPAQDEPDKTLAQIKEFKEHASSGQGAAPK
jgi:hypothetical protein